MTNDKLPGSMTVAEFDQLVDIRKKLESSGYQVKQLGFFSAECPAAVVGSGKNEEEVLVYTNGSFRSWDPDPPVDKGA